MNKATFFTEVKVTDPHSKAPVNVSMFRDEASGGLFGVDSSYFETFEDDAPVIVPNPLDDKGGMVELVDI
jgi:hypothetical protein